MRHLGLLLICLRPFACGAGSGVKQVPPAAPALSFQQRRDELTQVPGAQVAEGEAYEATLANPRAKIIKTYFKNVGINLRKISLNAVAESGASLELTLVQ